MKRSRYVISALVIVVTTSLGLLLYNQYRILKKDIEANKNMMELAIPGILSDLYDNMMFNRELRKYTNDIQGTAEFSFSSDSTLTDSLQIVLKNEVDRVLDLNYPGLEYEMVGFVSSEFGCMIHRNHRPELPKARNVLLAENHLCFCMILSTTLDIAMTYTNKKETVIGESARIIRMSFLLILIILIAFGYTIYTLRKQKKLSDLKRDFINNLTHEFKTPIFSISLAAKTLHEQTEVKASDKMNSYVDLIALESRRLQTQVDKILQMAMIDSGNLTMEPKLIDLHVLIRQVVESFSLIIAEKQGEINLHLNAENAKIVADETHFKNLIYNLIDNAQKYNNGAPLIDITTRLDGNQIEISIEDNGIGIDSSNQKLIFDQFYRAEKGDLHTVKGFGLGLSYVKRIVHFHKGSIRLSSTVGSGSIFTITIPSGK